MKEILEQTIQLRHELHAYPEVSLKEKETKKRLMNFIKSNSDLTVYDQGDWFYAYYEAGDPSVKTIAFRADFDALPLSENLDCEYSSKNPGVSHKCGHDGHSAALAGLALFVWKNRPKVNIYFIFQHGEEIGMGGYPCAEFLKTTNCEAIYAFHNRSGYPAKAIIYRDGLTQCASKGLTISLQGATAHASQPEDGRNPAFAIAELIDYSKEVANPENFEELVLCTLIHAQIGEKNFGIAAGNASISFTIRANREDDMNQIEDLLKEKAETLAKRDHLQCEYTITDPFPETKNHSVEIDRIKRAAERLRLERIEMEEAWRASEDFGYYTKQIPGAIFYIGNGTDYPQLHTFSYDFPDEIIETALLMYQELIKEWEV